MLEATKPVERSVDMCLECSQMEFNDCPEQAVSGAIRRGPQFSSDSLKTAPALRNWFRDIELSNFECHSHELRNINRLHFLHDRGPVVFGRPCADP